MKPLCVIAVIISITACVSSPAPKFYTLDMTPSGQAAPAYNIDVDRLRPSDALARNDLMIKKSDTEIEYYATDRWAGSLGELVAEKLEAEFGANVEGRETVLVSGTILGFEQVDGPGGATAHIKLDVALRREDMGRYVAPLLKKVYETNIEKILAPLE